MPLSQLQYLNNNHDWKIMISSSELFAYIPKKVENWDEEDVKKWFQLNGITINCDFQQNRGFDGAALLKATPQFLCFKCGLNKVLMMKVIEWIQYQRQEFEELVSEALQQSQQQEIKRSIEPTYRNSRMNIKQIQKQQEPAGLAIDIKDFATEKNKENSIRNNQKSIQAHSEAIQPLLSVKKWKKKEPIQRIQKSQKKSQKAIEGTSKDRQQASLSRADLSGVKIAQSHYEILQKILVFEHQGVISTLGNSGKIGRNVTNDVIFIEDSISRQHALILKQSGEYFIMDNQSKYGTFIQVGYGNRKTVTEGDIIAIQDEEFQITKYKFSKTTQTFDLKIRKIRDIQDKNNELFFSKKKQVTIGTDKAEIAYSPQLISPNHAKLTCDRNGVLNIVQLGGKCFRKLRKDELFKLDDGYQRIRLGFALITTKLKSDYKPFQMISAFQVPEQN